MTYIVNEKCIKCKLMDCVEVCPVDCFYEGKNMLVIKPDECIDCGVCEPECPIDAIEPDTNKGTEKWLDINKEYSEIWPNISEKKEPMKEHEKFFINTALTPWIDEYDVLFYVSPEGVEIEDNGVRETNAEYRTAIDNRIKSLIKMHRSSAITIKGTVEERIEQVKNALA